MRGVAWAVVVAGVLVGGHAAGADVDYGDQSSETLTRGAWKALEAGDFAAVAAYAGRCRELYAEKAQTQQAELTDFLPQDKAFDAWALNDVGTCCFIEGQALEKQDRHADAAAAYTKVVESYGYAQCWDPKGWFWRPAEAAAQRLKELDFEAALDAK